MPPSPIARIVPGTEAVASASGIAVTVSGDVRREADKSGGRDALRFSPGGRIVWESADLLRSDRGSVLLDFNYSTETGYGRDEPVLLVTDEQGNVVLRVTMGRVMFKVTRPPHEFAIDLYLNEAEGSWMRTALTWERLDDGSMYLRTTVNDRAYDRAIVPAFPKGNLKFLVGPENVSLREASFYNRPLPRTPHPHVNRAAAPKPELEAVRRLGFISESEQAALDSKGGVVVLAPEGALTQALPCGLRTLGLSKFRVVNDDGLASALASAAVLVLPDNDFWPPSTGRDAPIAAYVRAGGGLLAVGASAKLARSLGLVEFTPSDAGCEGSTEIQLNLNSTVLKAVPGSWSARQRARLELLTRRGPLYEVPASMKDSVVATEPLTGLPCALTATAGNGRVALTAAAPFGYYFWHPTFESVNGVAENAARLIFFKALLFHAAGVAFSADSASALAEPTSVPVDLSALRRMTPASEPPWPVKLGANGALSFWFRADTLNLTGADPRNLVWLSDGGENVLQLYYDPAEQFLVLKGASPNEESIVYANERTTWKGDAWRHAGVTWQATDTGDAAVALYIDGQLSATGGVPLPTNLWNKSLVGATLWMQGLQMEIRDFSIGIAPRLDLASIRAQAAPPVSWEDTPEELARMQAFVKSHRLALLGETHANHWKNFRTFSQYGLPFDVLMDKDLSEGALEKGGYSVLLAPGGGPPDYKEPLATRNRIRGGLRAGCGYVGICAGMFEAATGDPAKLLGLYRTASPNFSGTQLVDVQLGGSHPAASGVAGAFRDEEGRSLVRFVHMCGSPLRTADAGADTVAVAALGMAPALAASGSFLYGKGRGLVWAPHPELDGWAWWKPSDRTRSVMRQLFRRSVYYAAGAE